MGGIKAHYDGIKAFSETDFTEDLKAIEMPVLVMHGDDDQIVPYANSAPLSAKLLKHGTLEDLSRASARHVHDARGHHQQGPSRLCPRRRTGAGFREDHRRASARLMTDARQQLIATRGAQMFPRLTDEELSRLARFGEPRSYRAGEMLARVGEVGPGLVLILSGQVAVSQDDHGTPLAHRHS